MAKIGVKYFFRTMTAAAVLLGAGLLLEGCIGNTPLDDLAYAQPIGTPFDKALYYNYVFLARSFGNVGAAANSVFDSDGSWSLNTTDKKIAGLANTFAGKAVMASSSAFVDPEPASDPASHEIRDRLLRALETGREAFPRDAARAQVDFDCWLLNGAIEAQKSAAERCRKSLNVTLQQLESETAAVQAAAAAKAKAAQAKAPDASADAPK